MPKAEKLLSPAEKWMQDHPPATTRSCWLCEHHEADMNARHLRKNGRSLPYIKTFLVTKFGYPYQLDPLKRHFMEHVK